MMKPRRPTESPPTDPAAFAELLLEGNFVYTSATVPRQVLEQLGGYNQELTSAEDYDLWLRIATAGFPAKYIPGPLAVYRVRRGTLSSDSLQMARGELRAISDLVAASALRAECLLVAERRLAELRHTVARLERGRRVPLPMRVTARVRRFAGHGPLFRAPPPEVAGAFPDLVGAAQRSA